MTAAVRPVDIGRALEVERVRIIHGIITCPRCQKKLFHHRARSGEAWMQCNHERKERRGSCEGRWLNLTIPAGTIGSDLALQAGQVTAMAVIRLVYPHLAAASDAQLELVAIASGTTDDRRAPSHIQIVARGRDEHLYRWAPVGDVLAAMGLLR